jgi:uncharacterized membrane protein YeiB
MLIYIGMRHLPRDWERVGVLVAAGAVWLGTMVAADWYLRRFRARARGIADAETSVPTSRR